MLCRICHSDKSLNNFSFKNSVRGIRHRMCKSCHSEYRKKHYLENKSKYIDKALSWNKKQRQVLIDYLFKVLSASACIDCGEKDIIVLDFDHVSDKKFGISLMFRHRHSLKAIENEIKKCVIRCANCHRRKTAKEFGQWKFTIQHTYRGVG